MELLLFVPLGMYCVLLVTKDLEIFQLVLKVPGVFITLGDQVLELPELRKVLVLLRSVNSAVSVYRVWLQIFNISLRITLQGLRVLLF